MLILLHGLRSNEQDLIQLAPALDERLFIVSARAPLTMSHGAYAWYNVQFVPGGYILDASEADRSRAAILRFVEHVVNSYNVDPERVFVGGFSQGAAMAVSAALTAPALFAGVIAMSGRFIEELRDGIAPAAEVRGLPVIAVHGTRDSVIPVADGRGLRDALASLGAALTYREYDMAHEVTEESIEYVSEWIAARLNGTPDWRTASA